MEASAKDEITQLWMLQRNQTHNCIVTAWNTQTLVVVSPNPAVCDQLFLFAAFTDEIARKLAERLDSVEHLRCQAEWSLSVAFIFPNIEYVILNSLNLTKGFDILIVQFRHQLF